MSYSWNQSSKLSLPIPSHLHGCHSTANFSSFDCCGERPRCWRGGSSASEWDFNVSGLEVESSLLWLNMIKHDQIWLVNHQSGIEQCFTEQNWMNWEFTSSYHVNWGFFMGFSSVHQSDLTIKWIEIVIVDFPINFFPQSNMDDRLAPPFELGKELTVGSPWNAGPRGIRWVPEISEKLLHLILDLYRNPKRY